MLFRSDVAALLTTLAGPGVLAAGATVVVERARGGEPVALPEAWDVRRERTYGDTLVRILSVR